MSADPRSKLEMSMIRESIRQILEARSGPELVGASRLARALDSHTTAGFNDLLAQHGETLVPGAKAARRKAR